MAMTALLRPGAIARSSIRWPRPHRHQVPAVVGTVTVLAAALASASVPIAGRGDFGQWLMASRYYLGQEVPDYRTLSLLPPIVPLFTAGVRLVVPDQVAALMVVNALLLAGLGASLYLVGRFALQTRIAGVLSVTLGLLVTDRLLELFAFGGLLQVASLGFMCLAVACYARARVQGGASRWWALGAVSVGAAALAHLGTAAIAIPVGLAVAAVAALPGLDRRVIRAAFVPIVGVGLVIAAYWVLVLLPSSREYLTNPASLAYRGPDRLLSTMLGYWPTALVTGLGVAGIVAGFVGEARRRRIGPFAMLAVWAAGSWGVLGWTVLTGVATDYPRFAPVLLAPLIVGAAATFSWLARAMSGFAYRHTRRLRPSTLMVALATLLVVVAGPWSLTRHWRQADVYQPRDAAALTAAVTWLDERLGSRSGSVLTAVRDGKWLEGLTGRPALFSQPVRYAFRSAEWQRSVDADALLRSTTALTNEFFFVKFIRSAGQPAPGTPKDAVLAINHGGEFADVLRIAPSDTTILTADGEMNLAALAPVGVEVRESQRELLLRTRWRTGDLALIREVWLAGEGSTLRLIDQVTAGSVATVIRPVGGMAFTSVQVDGQQARACLTHIGSAEPCVRIWAAQTDATIRTLPNGALQVQTQHSSRLEIHVTALTIGEPSTGLALLTPEQLVRKHNVVAAILYQPDPAFSYRRNRLAVLGFDEAGEFGPYHVLVRDETAGSAYTASTADSAATRRSP